MKTIFYISDGDRDAKVILDSCLEGEALERARNLLEKAFCELWRTEAVSARTWEEEKLLEEGDEDFWDSFKE